MLISKIKKIHGHKVFRQFHWPTDLLGFSKYNLIFGWNGTGKTTLSNLFRAIEKRSNISEGIIEFEVDGRSVLGSSITAEVSLPQVRVFNRDFVSQNVFVSGGEANVKPIYYLGEESAEKQKKIRELELTIQEKKQACMEFENAYQGAVREKEKFVQDQARIIKAELSSSGENSFNNYDRRDFLNSCLRVTLENRSEKMRTEQLKSSLRLKAEARPKAKISLVEWTNPDWKKLREDVSSILGKTVISKMLSELSEPELSNWVSHGLRLHSGVNSTDACRFCGNVLNPNRIAAIQNHFNDEFSSLQSAIRTKIEDVDFLSDRFPITLPDKAAFHNHLIASVEEDLLLIHESVTKYLRFLQQLKASLVSKRDRPFELVSLFTIQSEFQTPGSELSDEINALNNLIGLHNSQNSDIQTVVLGARHELEMAFVAEAWEELFVKQKLIDESEKSARQLREEIQKVEQEVGVLERGIIDHRRSAEELNADLSSYLGRSELQFSFQGSGYCVYRNGSPAQNLSEGEKTAIAFLYFLKTLDDKEFQKTNGIVVIDDPVSSLDANSLFSAFGFMKSRTKEVDVSSYAPCPAPWSNSPSHEIDHGQALHWATGIEPHSGTVPTYRPPPLLHWPFVSCPTHQAQLGPQPHHDPG